SAGAGLFGKIGERSVAIVVPQHVALFHVLVGDVGDVDDQPAVVIVIGDIDVHALLGIESDGLLGHLGEGPVAVVHVQPVGAVIAGQINILPAVVVEIPVPDVE